jgi:hypothetical protein
VALTSLGMTGKRRVQDKIFCLGFKFDVLNTKYSVYYVGSDSSPLGRSPLFLFVFEQRGHQTRGRTGKERKGGSVVTLQ